MPRLMITRTDTIELLLHPQPVGSEEEPRFILFLGLSLADCPCAPSSQILNAQEEWICICICTYSERLRGRCGMAGLVMHVNGAALTVPLSNLFEVRVGCSLEYPSEHMSEFGQY